MYALSIIPFQRGLEEISFIKSYAYFIINAPIDICSINWCHKSQVLPVFTLQIFIIYVSWGAVSAEEEVRQISASLSTTTFKMDYASDPAKRILKDHSISNTLEYTGKNYYLSCLNS